LLREIIRERGGGPSSTLGITASTGIASVNIGGATLHSWAGVGLGDLRVKDYVGKFFGQTKFRNVLERWRKVRTLIVDEGMYSTNCTHDAFCAYLKKVSMIDGDLFDKLVCVRCHAVQQVLLTTLRPTGVNGSGTEA
jgi:ATP-dependent DNA helicase PIF1